MNDEKVVDGLRPPSRFQFSLFSMLVLTALVAGILALLRPLMLPGFVYVAFAVYAILWTSYFVLRIPYLYRLHHYRKQKNRLDREQLREWAEAKRKQQNDSP